MSKPNVVLLGTCDTKLSELLHVRTHLLKHDVEVSLIDVGRIPSSHSDIKYPQSTVLSHLAQPPDIPTLPRGDLIKTMSEAATKLVHSLYTSRSIAGVICIGGSGGTSLGASVLRSALPVGFPKLIVSTIASGDISSIIGETDMTIMNSVVDIAGTNSILDPILENAAGMIAGAAKTQHNRVLQTETEDSKKEKKKRKKTIAITMFGVTTPAATTARSILEKDGNFEVFIFHATGAGGRAMENLIRQHRIDGVLDLTTTELADELVGGIMSAGPTRLTAAGEMDIPQVVSLGALDMVNFGPRGSVPEEFVRAQRKLYEHNPDITLMRTSVGECRALGRRIAERLRGSVKRAEKVCVFVPEGGLSMLSVEGGVFEDRIADDALFKALEDGLEGSGIESDWDSRDINDEEFAQRMVERLREMLENA